MRILVVEDNHDILANLADYLSLEGYTMDYAQGGLSGLHLATTKYHNPVVPDVTLPGIDGYTPCRRLREDARRDTPVVMLTTHDQLNDRLQGLRSGADDYLVKPFALSGLSARIEAVLCHAQGGGRRELGMANLSYDLDALEVKRVGRSLELSPIGPRLLAVLMQKSPHVTRRDVLEGAVWGDDCPNSDNLRSHVYQLHQMIDKPFSVALLYTAHGVGYHLAGEPNGV